MAALVDVQFALPALAKLPSAGLDKETVDTCITLASLESPLVQAAAEALSAKGMPFAWDTDPEHAATCAKLVKAAVAAAGAEAAAASNGVHTAPVRLALLEHNQGDYCTFVGYASDASGRRFKVTYEPVDPAARPARISSTWYDPSDEEELADEEEAEEEE